MEKSSRIPELDGIRGLAILLVIFYHYTNGEALTRMNGIAYYVERCASLGWTGVNLFFVLSGFLIGGILIDARRSRSYFKTFYIRRFFRIIPIYYVWICLYLAMVSVAGSAIQERSFSGKALPHGSQVYVYFFFVQNLVPHQWAAQPGLWGSWFSHLWSLAVEEQFYLLAPLIVWWMSPRRLPAVLVGIICSVPFIRVAMLFHVHQVDFPRVMPSNADALGLGMLAAMAWRVPASRLWLERNIRSVYGTALVFFVGFGLLWWWDPGLGSLAMESVGLTWIAVFYTLLVFVVLLGPKEWLARVMRVGWLRSIGRVSYCMYVIHLMVNLFCHAVLLHTRPRIVSWSGAGVSLLAAVLTYAVASVSWKFFEGPLVKVGHGFVYSPPVESLARVDAS